MLTHLFTAAVFTAAELQEQLKDLTAEERLKNIPNGLLFSHTHRKKMMSFARREIIK